MNGPLEHQVGCCLCSSCQEYFLEAFNRVAAAMEECERRITDLEMKIDTLQKEREDLRP